MSQLNPVMSGKRLNSEPRLPQLEPNSRKNNDPRRGSTGAVGSVSGGIDPVLMRGCGNRSRIFWEQPHQYRATATMAATNNVAISESARSRAFERGLAGMASSGGMTPSRNVLNCAPGLIISLPWSSLTSAVSIRRQASRAPRTPWDLAISLWFQRARISGIRRYGSRSRTVPIPVSTAACDSAGTSGTAAVRWRKYPPRTLADIRAWRSLCWFRKRCRTCDGLFDCQITDHERRRDAFESDLSRVLCRGQYCTL